MAMWAVGLLGVPSGRAIAAENILAVCGQDEMPRIGASAIVAQMVKNWNTLSLSTRKWLAEPSVNNPMNRQVSKMIGNNPVAITALASDPVPASRLGVNLDLGKDALNLFRGEIYIEVLQWASKREAPRGVGGRLLRSNRFYPLGRMDNAISGYRICRLSGGPINAPAV